MNWKRLVRIITPMLLALVVFISFTMINTNYEEEVNTIKIPLDSITVAIMSMAEKEYNVVENEEYIVEEKIDVVEDINIVEDIEVAIEEIIVPEEKKETIAPSRGNASLDSRPQVDSNLSGYLNKHVLDTINTYKIGSENPYLLNNDYENYNGVTEDIVYGGELLLKAHPSGVRYSHCTGITFEVFFKAMQQRNKNMGIAIDDFNGMTKEELHDFILTWYVAKGEKSESNLTVAIEKYGLGNRITNLEDVRAGDFIDLSRENNTGHAVIFINWIRSEGKIIGLKHWSSQGSTNGISYKEEYFNIVNSNGVKYGNVIYDNLHIARVNPIGNYKNFK